MTEPTHNLARAVNLALAEAAGIPAHQYRREASGTYDKNPNGCILVDDYYTPHDLTWFRFGKNDAEWNPLHDLNQLWLALERHCQEYKLDWCHEYFPHSKPPHLARLVNSADGHCVGKGESDSLLEGLWSALLQAMAAEDEKWAALWERVQEEMQNAT